VYFPNIQYCKLTLHNSWRDQTIVLYIFIQTGTPHACTLAYRNDPEDLKLKRNTEMTTATRTHFTALFAAVVCAFMTVGFSVAPAVSPVTSYLA
jgi:hypothetical protein